MKEIVKLGFVLALVLCVHDALGQELTSGQAQRREIASAAHGVTIATGDSKDFSFRKPLALNLNRSALGDAARLARAEHAVVPRSRFTLEQDQNGKVVETPKPDATTDVWLYSHQ